MNAKIVRHALDKVPLSIIIDDSTLLVNLNYFWMRDRNPVDGLGRRWEDVPVVHPESFTREFAEWALENGVRGKFSVVPCPAALGRIDEGLPMFSAAQQASWLAMCRELIVPAWDITPEMITHSVVVDPKTCKPLTSGIWEQYEWSTLPDDEELLIDYITTACKILVNVGLNPQGVTSPGGFGGKTLERYAKVVGPAVRAVTGHATPYFFQRVSDGDTVDTPVWFDDEAEGTATGEIIACTDDLTGNWTGYGKANADYYITDNLTGGRLPDIIDKGQPAVLCSHWQGFYGLHNEDRRGFHVLKQVVQRLKDRDPHGEFTQWRTCSEITNYACARQMAKIQVLGSIITLTLPVLVPSLTLCVQTDQVKDVHVDGRPLQRAISRRTFKSGTYMIEDRSTLLAFDPVKKKSIVEIVV